MILVIGLVTAMYYMDETQTTYLVKINDLAYEKEDFNKFLAILQYEKEMQNKTNAKEGTEVEPVDMVSLKKEAYSSYLEQNVYYQKAIEKGVKVTEETKTYLNDFYDDEKTDKVRLAELGITRDDYMNIYSKSSIVQEFTNNIASYYELPNDTLNQYLNQEAIQKLSNMMDVRIMQFNVKEDAKKEDVKAKAQSILDKAKAGEDFETLAKENADSRLVASGDSYVVKNGEIETVAQIFLGELFTTQEVQEAVLKLNAGEFSEVYEQDGAYIFVKVEKITEGLTEEAKKKIKDLITKDYAVQAIKSTTQIIENKPLLKEMGLK
jgi:hypothetical protein